MIIRPVFCEILIAALADGAVAQRREAAAEASNLPPIQGLATVAAVYDRRRSPKLLYCRRSMTAATAGEPDIMHFLCKYETQRSRAGLSFHAASRLSPGLLSVGGHRPPLQCKAPQAHISF